MTNPTNPKSKYNHRATETKWVQKWQETQVYKTPELQEGDKKKYILEAFPYPSGDGLHVGHALPSTAGDISSRYYRLNGHKVLHPMGFDAFGLPTENYAIKKGIPPQQTTLESINNFRIQLERLGADYDWSREINTTDPNYYRWTQWLFGVLYKKGLAYKKEATVNWDPIDQTVLANEQVINGRAERSGAVVEQKLMSQWFFKITDYAERLLNDLDNLDWPESTKQMQRNWIGKSVGAEVDFQLEYPISFIEENGDLETSNVITVFTTRIDTLFSGTFLLLAPEHIMVQDLTERDQKQAVKDYQEITKKKSKLERTDLNKDWTGVFTGSYAINPATGEKMPIWVTDFVLAEYGTGAVFADAHDERDFFLGKKYGIPLKTSISPTDLNNDLAIRNLEICFTGYGILYNSEQFNGMGSVDAKLSITKWGIKNKWAREVINYRLRDWSIGRQRYWGCPIPIIYKNGVEELIPEQDLPLLLPTDFDMSSGKIQPLGQNQTFINSATDKYGEGTIYEGDTMDSFVCSSWYFFRFCNPDNNQVFADKDSIKKWMAVDQYIIGAEHSTLHLLYARFFTKVLFDEGLIDFNEPFLTMRHQGLILGMDGNKMSKSKGNTVNPLEVFEQYGADTLRMYEMFMGPFDQPKPWNTDSIKGVRRFIERVWSMQNLINPITQSSIEKKLHKLTKKIGEDIESYSFNTCVSEFMIFVNEVEAIGTITSDQYLRFIILLNPFAPFVTEEIYSNLSIPNKQLSIALEKWPKYDEKMLIDTTVKYVVQVNGKVRGEFEIETSQSEQVVIATAKDLVAKWLEDKEIKFCKVIANKLVTLVVG